MTYGVGVSLRKMLDPIAGTGRVAVGEESKEVR
jgi:hypothetical protein